ncbi:MAG: DUF5602 domain-containing protein [Alphaproteobacteria bacterium]
MDMKRIMQLVAGGALAVGLAVATGNAIAADGPKVLSGKSVAVGQGKARVVVATNAAGKPIALGVRLDAAALKGLPEATPSQHEWEYVLELPKGGPRTGFDHVVLNWNPKGHEPPGIYDTPHFDVHFYSISAAERDAITFKGTDKSGFAQPDAALVPAGYVVPPDTAVEKMGLHGIDPKGPEFRKHRFTHTFIYGYHKGRQIFVEPMIAKDFLESRPDVTTKIAVPAKYSSPGHYPTRYRVAYDPKLDQYVVMLTGLAERTSP